MCLLDKGQFTSRRHICRSYNLHPHQQRCAYTISPQKPHPSLRRYTFLSHLTTKSKISVRWIKKLVAATYGVCMFIHKLSPPHITPIIIYPFIFATNAYVICNGGSHPAAIYVVRTIYTPTNNVVPIQYLTKNLIPLCGDTLFYAFGYEIEDFYLTRKKTGRRYVRRVYVYTYIMPI